MKIRGTVFRCILSGTIAVISLLISQRSFAFGHAKRIEGSSITIAKDVPSDQANTIANDLKQLNSVGTDPNDKKLAKIMGLQSISSSALKSWLESRVQYIVSEAFDLRKAVYVAESYHQYPNTESIVVEEGKPANDGKIVMIMLNIGSALYYAGKQSSTLLGAEIPGVGRIPFTSPRVGLIQVGTGLVNTKLASLPNTQELNSMSDTLYRLGVFFHEARHSDGHGKSLIYAHAVCPEGHTYEGYNACDRNLNGPYTVGGLLLKNFAENCTSCTAEEKETLRLDYLDSMDRVIKVSPPPADWAQKIDNEIYVLNIQIETCSQIAPYYPHGNVPDDCKPAKIAQLRDRITQLEMEKNNPVGIPSTDWDPTPEGTR